MHTTLLLTHSVFRYVVLIFLLIVLVRSYTGWKGNKAFTALDDKFSLWLFISTHIQFTLGLILYFVSPLVIFSGASMKNAVTRYWLVEHIVMMIIAVALITAARSTSKKLPDPIAKHKRLFNLNLAALLIILVAIWSFKDRGFFTITM
jgi:hypothetical protein